MMRRNSSQPALQNRNPALENGSPRPGWSRLRCFLFTGCIILGIGFWTVPAAMSQMQNERTVIFPGETVSIHHHKTIFCKPSLSRFSPSANAYEKYAQWLCTFSEETESSDKRSMLARIYLTYGFFPLGLTRPGKLPPATEQSPRHLYLQNKSLLC